MRNLVCWEKRAIAKYMRSAEWVVHHIHSKAKPIGTEPCSPKKDGLTVIWQIIVHNYPFVILHQSKFSVKSFGLPVINSLSFFMYSETSPAFPQASFMVDKSSNVWALSICISRRSDSLDMTGIPNDCRVNSAMTPSAVLLS